MDDDELLDDYREDDVDLDIDEDEEDEDDGDEDDEALSAVADDPSDDESMSDDSDNDEDNINDSEPATPAETPNLPSSPPIDTDIEPMDLLSRSPQLHSSLPSSRERSLSPARIRLQRIKPSLNGPFSVEAVCALPHPCPTHSIAASACMSHLLTGSEDGYIRDYDIFASLNGRTFLSAPQRHHAGVVEGILKAGQLRCWWENNEPGVNYSAFHPNETEEGIRHAPVLSLAMQSDALWAAAGTDSGNINLFTVRHDPGYRFHVISGAHNGPISSLCLNYAENGIFSAGWDGTAVHWDLNSGQETRKFKAHGAQLSSISLKPLGAVSSIIPPSITASNEAQNDGEQEDARSDTSFDPLFDDPDLDSDKPGKSEEQSAMHNLAMPGKSNNFISRPAGDIPKNAPPLLDSEHYRSFSSDILLTAFVDGQVVLWDCRVNSNGQGVGRLWMNEKTPPWCVSACFSSDGNQIYAGRRNGTIDVWDTRQLGQSGPEATPRMLKTLKNPPSSGVVSCIVPFPDNKHIACASSDNLRLWNVLEATEQDSSVKSRTQFKIIPGHHGGYISQMLIDAGGRFLVSASSNRGWHGDSTRTVFIHDIKPRRPS